MHRFQLCTVASECEQELLSQAIPDYHAVEVVPNLINLADYEDVDVEVSPNTLIFTGSFGYSPNYKAMVWFLGEVYPRIRSEIPDVRLFLTGDHKNLPLPSLDNVTLTGFVDDVRPLIAASGASLVPLWHGGGTRLKILEAMALRTPVVSTSKGAEGLDAKHNHHLLIADSPMAFAEAVLRLLTESGLHQRLTDNAYRLVRQKYDRAVIIPQFLNLVERVVRA
jgi:glycosyltransferase involved in cell wall biosynthesis